MWGSSSDVPSEQLSVFVPSQVTRHCAISRFQMSQVYGLDEVANVTTRSLSDVLYEAILNELGDDEQSIRDAETGSSREP
jgi:hypothetical protein